MVRRRNTDRPTQKSCPSPPPLHFSQNQGKTRRVPPSLPPSGPFRCSIDRPPSDSLDGSCLSNDGGWHFPRRLLAPVPRRGLCRAECLGASSCTTALTCTPAHSRLATQCPRQTSAFPPALPLVAAAIACPPPPPHPPPFPLGIACQYVAPQTASTIDHKARVLSGVCRPSVRLGRPPFVCHLTTSPMCALPRGMSLGTLRRSGAWGHPLPVCRLLPDGGGGGAGNPPTIDCPIRPKRFCPPPHDTPIVFKLPARLRQPLSSRQ